MITKDKREYKNILYARVYLTSKESLTIKVGMSSRSYLERSKEYMPVEPFGEYLARINTDTDLSEAEAKLRDDFELFLLNFGGEKINGKVDWYSVPYKSTGRMSDDQFLSFWSISVFFIGYFAGLEAAFKVKESNFSIYPKTQEAKKQLEDTIERNENS